jgi:AAA ATPase domain
LVDELGIEPGRALRELQSRVLAQDPALSLTSSGPLRAATGPTATGNLRAQLSSFIGREAELEQLRDAVRSSRLVTLIGPGGAGKTRLAMEAAAALREEHRDGAWLVELAAVAEPDGVAPAAAVALGASAAGVPGRQPAVSTVELIVRHLAGRSMVVVIDNCEHVIAQAAILADILVGSVPTLRLIATSREPLAFPAKSWSRWAVWLHRPPSNCSWIALERYALDLPWTIGTAWSSRTSVADWMAFRWRSSSRPPDSVP